MVTGCLCGRSTEAHRETGPGESFAAAPFLTSMVLANPCSPHLPLQAQARYRRDTAGYSQGKPRPGQRPTGKDRLRSTQQLLRVASSAHVRLEDNN